MYSVSSSYKEALKQTDRNWQMQIIVETVDNNTFTLTADDVIEGSFFIEDEVMAGENIALGTVNTTSLKFSIDNVDDRFEGVQFYGATITPIISLETSEGEYEDVPVGVFTVIEAPRSIKTPNKPIPVIPLICFDKIVLLDKPFKNVTVNFPCTAGNLLQAICFYCGVTRDASAVTFLNSDYSITAAPEGDLSCRDILAYIAQLAGSWAKMNRQGHLTFKWFQNPAPVFGLDGGNFTDYQSGDVVDGGSFTDYQSGDKANGGYFSEVQGLDNCFDFSIENTPITVTGLALKRDEDSLLAGEEGYVIEIDNPLIQNEAETILTAISDNIIGLSVLSFNSIIRDDPSIDGGDLIEFKINDKCYRSVIFKRRYKYRGKCQLVTDVKHEIRLGYKPSSVKNMSIIREKLAKKQQQLDALDLAIKNASQMIAGIWGGHVINGDDLGGIHDGNMYISDDENPSLAQKIWRWNLGGLGYSSNGINGPFTAAITADGSIVASLITASMIQAGMLQSLNGKSWIDLDNGAFSMGDGALKWDATNGFEAVAAKKIANNQNSPFFGTIGSLGDISALQLVQQYTEWFVQMYAASNNRLVIKGRGGVVLGFIDNPGNVNIKQVVYGDDGSTSIKFSNSNILYGDNNFSALDYQGGQAMVRCDVDGARVFRNGFQRGINQDVPADSVLMVENGLIVGWY